MDKQLWCKLVQRYAIRAREYSEAVAALGQKANGGPVESQQLLDDIRTRLESCIAVAQEIDRYFKEKAEAASGK